VNSWNGSPHYDVTSRPSADRQEVALAARLTWKDQRGASRFVTGVIRGITEHSAFIECHSVVPMSMFRLVQLQLERGARDTDAAPMALRKGRVLTAVYGIVPPTPSGQPQGFDLRMMIEPTCQQPDAMPERATA
jgi:hypothetical protein